MTKNNKEVKIEATYKGIENGLWSIGGVYHFKVQIIADRKSYPIDFYQGLDKDFDQESFLDSIISDIVAVMQYGDTIKSLCENYLILSCGMDEGSKTIQTAVKMRDNLNKIKHAFYNEEDFNDWVEGLAEEFDIIQ